MKRQSSTAATYAHFTLLYWNVITIIIIMQRMDISLFFRVRSLPARLLPRPCPKQRLRHERGHGAALDQTIGAGASGPQVRGRGTAKQGNAEQIALQEQNARAQTPPSPNGTAAAVQGISADASGRGEQSRDQPDLYARDSGNGVWDEDQQQQHRQCHNSGGRVAGVSGQCEGDVRSVGPTVVVVGRHGE